MTKRTPFRRTRPTAQVAAEAILGVTHFGYDPNGSYIVATPNGRNSTGFGTQWCAYHSAHLSTATRFLHEPAVHAQRRRLLRRELLHARPKDESGTDEGVTIVEGHEYGESISDPNPLSGWYNGAYGEIGDICAWTDIQNEKFRKKSYTMQPMWSNATQSCVHSY